MLEDDKKGGEKRKWKILNENKRKELRDDGRKVKERLKEKETAIKMRRETKNLGVKKREKKYFVLT